MKLVVCCVCRWRCCRSASEPYILARLKALPAPRCEIDHAFRGRRESFQYNSAFMFQNFQLSQDVIGRVERSASKRLKLDKWFCGTDGLGLRKIFEEPSSDLCIPVVCEIHIPLCYPKRLGGELMKVVTGRESVGGYQDLGFGAVTTSMNARPRSVTRYVLFTRLAKMSALDGDCNIDGSMGTDERLESILRIVLVS